MAKEILPSKDERVNNVFKVERPDFSSFDEPVLNWSLTMSNSIDKEDTMTITFSRIPTYDGQPLAKAMDIDIPAGKIGTISMKIREISYNITPSKATTTILLATRKIYLDNFITKGFVLEKEGPSPNDVFKALSEKIGLGFKEVITDDVPWVTNKVRINGRQNVLDYLRKVLSVDSTPIYNWWIDAFNNFHLHERTGINATPIDIPFDDVKGRLNAFDVRLYDKFSEKKISVAHDLNEPKTSEPKDIEALKAIISSDKTKVDVIGTQLKEPARRGSAGKVAQKGKALKKIANNMQYATLNMIGIYWAKAHSKVKLSDFPLGDGEYIVSDVIIRDGDVPETMIILQTLGEELPKLKRKKKRIANRKRRKEKQAQIKAQIRKSSTKVKVEGP